MKFGSLFAGIGGLDLGLERAGMTCAWQVELDPFCSAVLAKHWPNVKRYKDVTKFARRIYDCEPADDPDDDGVYCARCDGAEFGDCECIGTDQLLDEAGWVDLICGGFPCQDISQIGKQEGITDGEQSGLWREYARIIGQLEPRYVLVENVPALLGRDIGVVLGSLAALGYDAEWDCVPAAAVGANHIRDRVFILAHRQREGLEGHPRHEEGPPRWAFEGGPTGARGICSGQRPEGWWASEPGLGRVAHGVPRRVDRLTALGNAVVPQVAEWIGKRIMALEVK